MTDLDRNTRTLIVCFVVAVLAMIPLRFIEVSNYQTMTANTQVLGESVIVPEKIKLPDADVDTSIVAQLEAPYNEVDGR